MSAMLRSRDRALRRRRAAAMLVLCGSVGCDAQDLSIGWQDVGRSEAGANADVREPGSDSSVPDVGTIDTSSVDVGALDLGSDAGRFSIIWRDDFDTLDPGRWEVAEHTFEENYADFALTNAFTEGGYLKIAVRVKPPGTTGKAYTAAEVRTWAPFACGKFQVRSRIAPATGVATTFFAFHDFFQNASAQDWNEIVIESSAPSRIDYVYTRENPSLPQGKERVPTTRNVSFDATADFHVYGFEWTPTEVRYLVDGVAQMTLPSGASMDLARPKRVVMSAYPSTRLTRSFDPAVLPTEAWYDWIEVYRFNGPCPTGADAATDAPSD